MRTSGDEKVVKQRIPHLYGAEDLQFARTMGTLLGMGILEGNQVDVLLNGDEIFPAMLHAIRSAKTTITFETFIYWSGSIGGEFTNALAERARAGVKVHVLLDWIGSNKMDASQLSVMEQAGVRVRKYHKPHWYQFGRLNNRTHRKLLVVDGHTGFTVGVESQINGLAMRKTLNIGAIRTVVSEVPWWPRCKRSLWTTGSKSAVRYSTGPSISLRCSRSAPAKRT